MTQTDRVLIALTKPGPRTPDAIAMETRIPVASVRRVLSHLRNSVIGRQQMERAKR